ncbi:MAG: hypothetical protein P4L27_13645 [Ignavibacteriaceae bacterium]|nr:hypothetical protein [Ignavibacteriaceae bacterium]
MKQNIILWLGTIIITFLAGYMHNVTGPDYPVSGTIGIHGQKVTFKFDKIYSGNDSYNVIIKSDVKDVKAFLLWKDIPPYHLSPGLLKQLPSVWHRAVMSDSGSFIKGRIPKHNPETFAAYRTELNYNGKQYFLPEDKPVTIKFLGYVNSSVMNIFYFVLFGGLILAVRTGLESFNNNRRIGMYTIFTCIFFFLYAVCLVPLKSSYELNALNHFVPPIHSLITFQSLSLLLLWIIGLSLIFNFKGNKIIPLVLSSLTVILYIFIHL